MATPDSSLGPEEIEHRFGFHKATIEGENATLPKHKEVRLLFREFAEKLDDILPPGRAKSVAFTELESASMWTHKSIAELAPALEETRNVSICPSQFSPRPDVFLHCKKLRGHTDDHQSSDKLGSFQWRNDG